MGFHICSSCAFSSCCFSIFPPPNITVRWKCQVFPSLICSFLTMTTSGWFIAAACQSGARSHRCSCTQSLPFGHASECTMSQPASYTLLTCAALSSYLTVFCLGRSLSSSSGRSTWIVALTLNSPHPPSFICSLSLWVVQICTVKSFCVN